MSLVFLGAGFGLDPGKPQLLLLTVGLFFAAGTAGAAGALVCALTAESIRATAFGTLTLANNLLGLAAGPLITGILADRLGLESAMKIVPMVAVGAVVALYLGRRAYPASLAKIRAAGAAR
jgi:MFS family permease